MSQIHTLKTWPEHWDAVECGEKTFEARKNDRGFAVGDILVLHRFDPETGYHFHWHGSPMLISKRVLHILHGGAFGIEPGHVVMSLGTIESKEAKDG